MEGDDGPKKRGRKPKIVVEPIESEEVRKRKRGRKPKCEITSIHEIREKFKDSDDKVIFHGSQEPIENNLEQVQVPFGNLNITVHTTPKIVDKNELRNMFSKPVVKPQIIKKEYDSDYSTDESEYEEEEPKQDFPIPKQPKNSSKPKFNKLLYKISDHIANTNEWPKNCNTLCWWCCHPFDGIPIPCVSKYDSITKRFKVYGIFCSWECSAAFGFQENNSLLNLLLLKKRWTGDLSDTNKAPSRYLLTAFGGFMSIEEFRNSNSSNIKYHISTSTMDLISQNCIEYYPKSTNKNEIKVKPKPTPSTNSFFGI